MDRGTKGIWCSLEILENQIRGVGWRKHEVTKSTATAVKGNSQDEVLLLFDSKSRKVEEQEDEGKWEEEEDETFQTPQASLPQSETPSMATNTTMTSNFLFTTSTTTTAVAAETENTFQKTKKVISAPLGFQTPPRVSSASAPSLEYQDFTTMENEETTMLLAHLPNGISSGLILILKHQSKKKPRKMRHSTIFGDLRPEFTP